MNSHLRSPAAASLVFALVAGCQPGLADTESESGSSSSSASDGPTSSSSAATEDPSSSSTGEPCPVGGAECPCTDGGACDPGLVCELGTCVEGCAVGSLNCACTQGGTCDGGLTCSSGFCIEGVSETCGDGVVDEFEECDLGAMNSDAGACTTSCRTATCGDGFVGPGESCDGGDGCSPACVLTTCGDGKLDRDEECEPAGPDDEECSPACTDARKIIFVTSEMYKGGEIGGVAGGDEKCQGLAAAAGLPGEFKSWLATSKDDAPLVRFSWHLVPYVDVAGEVLAEDWTLIYNVDGKSAPALTEEGAEAASGLEADDQPGAWASTLDDAGGPSFDTRHCNGWTDLTATGSVTPIGKGSAKFGAGWVSLCDAAGPLLCVEQ